MKVFTELKYAASRLVMVDDQNVASRRCARGQAAHTRRLPHKFGNAERVGKIARGPVAGSNHTVLLGPGHRRDNFEAGVFAFLDKIFNIVAVKQSPRQIKQAQIGRNLRVPVIERDKQFAAGFQQPRAFGNEGPHVNAMLDDGQTGQIVKV